MVSNLIGKLKDKAEDNGVKQSKEAIGKADKILDGGPPRTPAEIASAEGQYKQGEDLSTADGKPPKTATSPTDKKDGDDAGKTSTASLSKPIEFIHCGIVHHDAVRNFAHAELDDTGVIDGATLVGSRAIMFRAALEREAVLLGGLVTGTQMAFKAMPPDMSKMHQKDTPADGGGGAIDQLLGKVSDLVGGKSAGAAQTAGGADLAPFLDRLANDVWTPLNKDEITYDGLHDAGMKLHEVRVSLRTYLRTQIAAKKDGPAEKKGLLSDLPIIGQITIPGEIGKVLGFMQMVTDKIQDVKTLMVMNLMLTMGPAMDAAAHQASIDAIRKKVTPIYPVWFLPPAEDPKPDHSHDKIADRQQGDVVQGQLAQIPGADTINQGVKDAVKNYYNDPINTAAKPVMDVIDFLQMNVKPAPGSAYLAQAFQVTTAKDATPGPLEGGKALGEVAFTAFATAMGDGTIPSFMSGFVKTFVTEVFVISVEFLRAVYDKLCSLKADEVVSTDALVTAGRSRLLNALVDLGLQKSGLDALIKAHPLPNIPKPPFTPPGVTWPSGALSVDPLIAEFKKLLTDKLAPYINPAIDYVMSGLAERLNAQRAWATPSALTMEAHIAQLPGEITQMFIGLFGPLWSFINDTLMGVVNDAVGKVLGPAGEGMGLARDGLANVSKQIDHAEKMADAAKKYATKVEQKVGAFLDQLKNVNAHLGPGGDSNLKALKNAASDVGDAVGADPFAAGPGEDPNKRPGGGAGADSAFQPSSRAPGGTGVVIDDPTRAKVEPDKLQWDKAAGDAATGGGVKS